MSSKYKFLDQHQAYFVSFATVQWIDIFTRRIYFDIIIESLKYCQIHKGLRLFAWCIMPNHIHLIMGTYKIPMQIILKDLKSYTSREIKNAIISNPYESRKDWIISIMQRAGQMNSNNKNWQFWQQDNHPIELSSNKIVDQKLDYLHNNPVKAGFVEIPEHWLYSSARDYCGLKGLLDVEVVI